MSREIKFRVWDGSRMIYLGDKSNDTALWVSEDYWVAVDHFTGAKEQLCDSTNKDAVLMQFTGLKDNDGKEIYEGDILKAGQRVPLSGRNPHEKYAFSFAIGALLKVVFHDGCFKISRTLSSKKKPLHGLAIRWCGLTVIGSIYG